LKPAVVHFTCCCVRRRDIALPSLSAFPVNSVKSNLYLNRKSWNSLFITAGTKTAQSNQTIIF
jgi:hypothetical protein